MRKTAIQRALFQLKFANKTLSSLRQSSLSVASQPRSLFAPLESTVSSSFSRRQQCQQESSSIRATSKRTMASFDFGTRAYAKCFLNLPDPDVAMLRQSTIDYLDSYDPKIWYDDPIISLLNGKKMQGGQAVDTIDALGKVNGKQVNATPEQIQALKQHITTYKSAKKDLRAPVRDLEKELLTTYAGFLIGNQCLDFCKQDGITEMEESTMANAVEQRLNDLLLIEEKEGNVNVSRKPIYVSCVSNFTNFLDLFRKTLRSIEVGIPCVVLGRSNTAQHPYRWTQLLVETLFPKYGIDPGMITFLACSLDDIKDITVSCQASTGNLYTTCSRELAASIKSGYPNTVASTGGPNTLVVMDAKSLSMPRVKQAIQTSASIECAGQCTALRHCVVPSSSDDATLKSILTTTKAIDQPQTAVKEGLFDAVFAKHAGTPEPPFQRVSDDVDAYCNLRGANELPPPGIEEYWRKVVVDFTKMDITDYESKESDELAAWLNENQPISLAVNGPRKDVYKLAVGLWEKTGMVVNTIGSSDDPSMPPAMTCQARPQEAEVFGEFPPRSSLSTYTKFPVVVPSSNPSYDTTYTSELLLKQTVSEYYSKTTQKLLHALKNDKVRGFCVLLIEYLKNACSENPRLGFGKSRTAVWGIQTPPLGRKTYLRCSADAAWEDVCPVFMCYYITTAREQMDLSIDAGNEALIELCKANKLSYTVETDEEHKKRQVEKKDVFNTVNIAAGYTNPNEFPMAGNFVSLYFPLGHIKSTMPEDEQFVVFTQISKKWLKTIF